MGGGYSHIGPSYTTGELLTPEELTYVEGEDGNTHSDGSGHVILKNQKDTKDPKKSIPKIPLQIPGLPPIFERNETLQALINVDGRDPNTEREGRKQFTVKVIVPAGASVPFAHYHGKRVPKVSKESEESESKENVFKPITDPTDPNRNSISIVGPEPLWLEIPLYPLLKRPLYD